MGTRVLESQPLVEPLSIEVQALLQKRIVLLTGKGGVGRSVMTAALATVAQQQGVRVMVCEIVDEPTDYSPLARHFGAERLPSKPTPVAEGILAVALVAHVGQELFLKSVLRSGTLARAALSSDALRKLLSAGPSFREMGVFFQLLTYLRQKRADGSDEFELILVDMPATGHTLSLTGLPEVLLRLLPRGPIAEALKEGQRYLNDPKLAAACIVTLAETLPVSECLELIDGLKKTQMPAGAVLLNRLPADPFSAEERAALAPLMATGQFWGGEGFARHALSQRETHRLQASTSLAILPVAEIPVTAKSLIESAADALSRCKALQRVEPAS